MNQRISNRGRGSELFRQTLEAEGLRIDDPRRQTDLLPEKRMGTPPTDAEPENRYNYRIERIFCYACGRHNHFEGMTVIMSDGTRALVGNCCAREYFGDDAFKKLVKSLEAKENDAYYRHHLAGFGDAIFASLDEVVLIDHLCQSIEQAGLTIKYKYANLWEELIGIACRSDGRLVVDLCIVDYTANDENGKEKYTYTDKIIGAISGCDYLRHADMFSDDWRRLSHKLQLAKKILDGVPTRTPELEHLSNVLRREIKPLAISLLAQINGACDFFTTRNIELISRWKTEERIGRLQIEGYDEIKAGKDWEKALSQIFPIGFEKPSTEIFQKLLSI